jgi:superfamily II DNA or RNA helicase
MTTELTPLASRWLALREWLELLDPLALEVWLSPERVEALLALELRYRAPPRVEDGRLVAVLYQEGSDATLPAGISVERQEGVVIFFGQQEPAEEDDDEPASTDLDHDDATATLLLDLCASAPLRAALLSGGDTSPAAGLLPLQRRALLERDRIERAFSLWAAEPHGGQHARLVPRLKIVDHRGRAGSDAGAAARAPQVGLEIAVVDEASGVPLWPQQADGIELPHGLARVLSLCEGRSADLRRWAPLPGAIDAVLSALRRLPLLLDTTGKYVRFADEGVRPTLVAGERLASELAAPGVAPRPAAGGSARARHRGPMARTLEVAWRRPDGRVLLASEVALLGNVDLSLWVPDERAFLSVPADVVPGIARRMQARPVLPRPSMTAAAGLYDELSEQLRGTGVALPPADELGLGPGEPPSFALKLRGTPLMIEASLEARYESEVFPVTIALEPALAPGRDVALEARALERAIAAGLGPGPTPGTLAAEGDEAVRFCTEGLARLRAAGEPPIELLVPAELDQVLVRAPLQTLLRVALIDGWLSPILSGTTEGLEVEMSELREALALGRRWVRLRDGSLARLTEAVASLAREIDDALGHDDDGVLPRHQLGLVQDWTDRADRTALDPRVKKLRARLRALAVSTDVRVPRTIKAELRPYQKQGLAWLEFLVELGAGGILADDMGLGKTLTTLAIIASRKHLDGPAPSLVVCPTSVVYNWAREAAQFAPSLRVVSLHGAGRWERAGDLGDADLVLTSYGTLRNDIEILERRRFRFVVLDEAQNVKNAASATAFVARRLDADLRLCLSGTPVENRLSELWALVDFCNPGMLGSANDFDHRFARPIADRPDGPEAAALRALLRPFVLRRTKQQVLTELPPTQESELWCEPTPKQRKVYDAMAAMMRQKVEQEILARGLSRSGLSVLTALLRLRQIACDPRLVDPRLPASSSGKRTLFLETVRGLIAGGRRALVFSQFVELLTLLRRDLDRERIAYEYLDGSTHDREAVVNRFQQGTAPCFLISLKAGGAGLNLTAADTVILCDPWWNPAVEDQASGRAHRIGQERKVTVFRLVMRGTVEERIQALKERKRALARAVVGEDAGALRGLSEGDVKALLGGIGGPERRGADGDENEADAGPEAEHDVLESHG